MEEVRRKRKGRKWRRGRDEGNVISRKKGKRERQWYGEQEERRKWGRKRRGRCDGNENRKGRERDGKVEDEEEELEEKSYYAIMHRNIVNSKVSTALAPMYID